LVIKHQGPMKSMLIWNVRSWLKRPSSKSRQLLKLVRQIYNCNRVEEITVVGEISRDKFWKQSECGLIFNNHRLANVVKICVNKNVFLSVIDVCSPFVLISITITSDQI